MVFGRTIQNGQAAKGDLRLKGAIVDKFDTSSAHPVRDSFMKTSRIVPWFLALACSSLSAQTIGSSTQPVVVDKGSHYNLWQYQTYEPGPKGKPVAKLHQYRELADGLNYQDANGVWTASREEISAFPAGAIAIHGQNAVVFGNNLNAIGAIDLTAPDHKRLTSNILGLGYYEKSTGNSVTIAQIHDCQGELISSNQVLYSSAFRGLKADVRYTYRKGSFEQDVILREQPPTPESVGLNSQDTEIYVMTEFINPPQETIKQHNRPHNEGVDQDVSWGAIQLGHGKAFDLGDSQTPAKEIFVRRQYGTIQGRKILLELVPLPKILTSLSQLPLQSSAAQPKPLMLASKSWQLPKTPASQNVKKPLTLARLPASSKGFVLDYVQINSDYDVPLTFQGDTTYYISSSFGSHVNTTIEGGAVIKFNPNAYIWNSGGFNCQTSPYHPAVFTSMNDNSVGETIPGSTGTPTFGGTADGSQIVMDSDMSGSTMDIVAHDLRFCYMSAGLGWWSWGDGPYYMDVWNCQFLQVGICIGDFYGLNLGLHNVLFANCATAVNAYDFQPDNTIMAEHVTADVVNFGVPPAPSWMTNSIVLESSGPTATLIGNSVITTSPALPLFQTVGGGSYYLTNFSPYRSVGTTNISPAMLAMLGQRTTYPPIVYTVPGVSFTNNLNLYPQVQRDTNGVVDLGYHYDPLDYMLGSMFLTNASIVINPGTAIGIFTTSNNAYSYGLAIANNASFTCTGLANNLAHIALYNTVQEQAATAWKEPWFANIGQFSGMNCVINCNFTDWSVMAQDAPQLCVEGGNVGPFNFQNCQFHGGSVISWQPTINFSNCLFERVNSDIECGDNNIPVFRNNLVYGGTFGYGPWVATNAVVHDNLFDHATIPDWIGGVGGTYSGGYNAYVTTNYGTLNPTYASDMILSASPAYQTSWFGKYYLPSNSPLINAGSTTADQVGLYHFTTQTNQAIEANSVVDIGYHYVATDANGNPLDSNGDGIPDYIEDVNGNGISGLGQMPWGITIENPVNGAVIY